MDNDTPKNRTVYKFSSTRYTRDRRAEEMGRKKKWKMLIKKIFILFSVFHLILLLSQFTRKSLSLLIYGYLSTISQCWSLLWHLSSSYLFFRPVLNEIYEKLLIHLIVHLTSSINSSLLHRVREFAPLLSWMSLTFYRTIADKLRTRPWQVITGHWHSLALALLLLYVYMVKSSQLCDACVRKLYLEMLQIHRLLVDTEPHETSSSEMWNDHHLFVISYIWWRGFIR